MSDTSTLEVEHCHVCYEQRAPSELEHHTWEGFKTLYEEVETQIPQADRAHFSCLECFPRDTLATFPVCLACQSSLEKRRLPLVCRVNNLAVGCLHRIPAVLKDLSPLEERLIGIYTTSGWITKLTIDIDKWTSGRYRKHIRGHITVSPNDTQGVAAEVLPHPLVEERHRLHVCFVGPRKPVPSDLGYMLSVDPQKLKRALSWLKQNNPLYRDITISDDNLESWSDSCPGTEVPVALFEQMDSHVVRAEDEIRTGHYVPSAERGRPEGPIRDANEIIMALEDREADAASFEAEAASRLGGMRTTNPQPEEIDPQHIEAELFELTSTGLMASSGASELTPR
ncbi:hypothetical protein CSOJ01_16016, partial [Colletotrichum sojae]